MNVFNQPEIANEYDAYYLTDFGRKVDKIEKKIVSTLIKNISINPMLELGCGTGHWTEHFERKGFQVTGIDISDNMLNFAKKKNLKAEFLKGDSSDLLFLKESFSMVASITMLEFVESQDKVLQEIYRVLKPEGWLLLGCINADSVIGKTKAQSETFKNANFLTIEQLKDKLKTFGNPEINVGVYLNDKFEIIDQISQNKRIEPVFMAALIQKTN